MANLKKDIKGAGLRTWSISLAIVILCIFFMLMFTSSFLNTTNPNSEILNGDYGLTNSTNRLSDSMNVFSNIANKSNTLMSGANPGLADYLFLIADAFFTIPKGLLDFFISGIGTLGYVLNNVSNKLGSVFSILIGVIFSVLTITGVLLIIKAIRSGETEK